jgi:YD repeat-containing protein
LDPLGRKVSRVSDAVGRPQSLTNALGQAVQYQYSPLNQVNQITDPLNGLTAFTYDANGNLLTLTDALGSSHKTTYTYDNMDRVATRKDALPQNPAEIYQYDLNGNLKQFTDRRTKVTTFQYDKLNRRIFAGFGPTAAPPYDSTITYTYDAATASFKQSIRHPGRSHAAMTVWTGSLRKCHPKAPLVMAMTPRDAERA